MNMTTPPQTVELDNVLILIIIGHKGEQKWKICEKNKKTALTFRENEGGER